MKGREIHVWVMNAAPFQNLNGSSCLNAEYDIDQEGLKVSMGVLGTDVAEDNKWLLEYCALVSYHMHQPENCIYRLRVYSKVLQDSQRCVYSRAAFLVRGYVWIDCSMIRANASKDEPA